MIKRLIKAQFEWLTALPLLIVAGVLVVIALAALAGAQSPNARSREALFDFYQRLAPTQIETSQDFHLVTIDRDSVNEIGPWPWPRTVLARLVDAAGVAGAKAVILTEAVDAPDPLSPDTIGDFWLDGASDAQLANQLSLLPNTDSALATSFGNIAGAVAVSQTPMSSTSNIALARADVERVSWLDLGDGDINYVALPSTQYLYGLNEALRANPGPSVSALSPDADGVLRRLPLLWSLNGVPATSLSLEAARIAISDKSGGATISAIVDKSSANASGRTIRAINYGDREIFVPKSTMLRLHLPKRLEIPMTSAARLLNGETSNTQLKDAVIFIGLDRELGISVQTARGELTPASLHALAAAQLLHGAAPSRPSWIGIAEALAVMIFGAAAIMIAQRLQFWQAVGFAAAVSVALTIIGFGIFMTTNVLADPLAPALAMFAGALSIAGGRSIGGVMREDHVRGSFHDTLPSAAMQELRDGNVDLILSGGHREITVLACELRLVDEDLQTLSNLPEHVTRMISSASTEIRKTIIETGGVADQAEGGRIFAYYNAPIPNADHQQTACAAALRLIESMDRINELLENTSRTRNMQIHLAIGVATGNCFFGPMGQGRNNRYSAIGPAVDRATFLRQQSEYYGPAMICDEPIYRATHHHFAFLELDMLKTKVDMRPFSIYALIGNPFIKSSKGFRNLDETHRELLTAYRAGDFVAARKMLDHVKALPGAKIALFDIYDERLTRLAKTGAPDEWDGAEVIGI